ncbi:hypothetical protein HDV02_004687 [Globomyces sp. JEL0801]|nr:hypothetical protein HDV02_004687 [Globomyces sp. JEL0801]
MAFPVLQSVSLLCLLAGGASGTLQGPGVFGNNVASDSRTFIGQLGSMDGGGILSLSLDWTAIAGLQPLVTPIWAQVNVLVACIGFAWVLTPLYVYFNVWGSQTFPAISVEGYHLNGTFYNLWRVMDFKTVTIPITKQIPDLYVSPSFAFVIGCRFAVMSAAVVHFLLYYAKSSWSIFRTSKSKLIQRDVHSRMMLQYPDVPAHWYFLCMGISTLAAMFVTHHYRTEFQSEWWNVPFALALSGCFSLPFGIIRAISNQSLNFNVLAQFIMGMLKPGYILANVTFRGFCSAIMDTALMYCVSMKLGQYMKIPPRLTFIYHLWGIIVSSFGNFTVLDMAMTMMAKHARNWAQSFSQSAWKANQYNHGAQWTAAKLPKMLMTSAQIWGGVSPKRFFTSETGYDNLYWFFVIGAIFPIMNYIMLRNFPRIGFHYINWPIIFQAVGLVPIGFANSILSVAIVTFITQHLVRKYNRRWYDRYNYILSGALDSAAIIVPVIVFFLNRGIPELSTSLNSPLNPNKTIFGPDYCGNVNRSSWIKQPRENRTRIP